MKGESYEEAIKREMKEELGVDLPVTLVKKFIHPYPYETEMETLYTAKSNGPFSANPSEIDGLEFVSKSDLPRKLLAKEIQLTSLAERSLQLVGFL